MKSLKFKTRITLIFFLTYSILSLYIIGVFYFKSVAVQKEQLRQRLMQVSELGADMIDASLVDFVIPKPESMDRENYKNLVQILREIRDSSDDIDDIYILTQTNKPGIMKFVANADEEEVVECGEDFDVTSFPELFKAFEVPSADKEITQDKWGFWLSGYAPIKHDDGKFSGILGVDISAERIGQMQNEIKRNALYVFLIGIIMSVIIGNLVSWWLTKPMKRLMRGMDEICSGNLGHKIPVESRDEFGKLSENFNHMAEKLEKYIKDLTEATKERERINRELEIAAELQKAMLPHHNIDAEELDLAGLSLPARQVGGDYFDYINQEGDNIGFVIADATGKGLHSSIFMTNSKSIFKIMTTEETSPAEVIRRTNDLVINNIDTATATMFATMFYGIYDKKKMIFKYSNAGHNPPIFISGDGSSVKLLSSHGFPIGISENQKYGESDIKMNGGDMIILYTDGVVEAINDEGEEYGMNRLKEISLSSKGLTAQEMVAKIKEDVFNFAGDQSQFDDLTLLVFRVK